MQKLEGRNTYAPLDASPVQGDCDSPLNREETLSVPSSKTPSNNSEENPRSGKSEQDSRVPVLNMHGKPLMPTKPQKEWRNKRGEKAIPLHPYGWGLHARLR